MGPRGTASATVPLSASSARYDHLVNARPAAPAPRRPRKSRRPIGFPGTHRSPMSGLYAHPARDARDGSGDRRFLGQLLGYPGVGEMAGREVIGPALGLEARLLHRADLLGDGTAGVETAAGR